MSNHVVPAAATGLPATSKPNNALLSRRSLVAGISTLPLMSSGVSAMETAMNDMTRVATETAIPVGEVSTPVSEELHRRLDAHRKAYADFENLLEAEILGDDAWERHYKLADEAEKKALSAICSYQSRDLDEAHVKATYLIFAPGCGDEEIMEEHAYLVLHSMVNQNRKDTFSIITGEQIQKTSSVPRSDDITESQFSELSQRNKRKIVRFVEALLKFQETAKEIGSAL